MIVRELCSLYNRMLEDPDRDVPVMGWSSEKVAWEIIIDQEGSVREVLPLASGETDGPVRYRVLKVPEHETRSSGIKPYFCCDNAKYLFGLDEKRGVECLAASRDLHNAVLATCDDAEARALLRFFGRDDHLAHLGDAVIETIFTGGFMVFRMLGASHRVHDASPIREAWNAYGAPDVDAPSGYCSVTGKMAPRARLFPQIAGLPGAQSSGASLVSFNFDACESYGMKKTYNASLSAEAAFAAGTALREVLGNRERRIRFGNTFVVFWADRPAPREESAVFQLFGGALPAEDDQTNQQVQQTLLSMRMGKKRDGAFDFNARFCVLGISPNAARLSARFFYQSTFGDLMRNYAQYLEDIEISGVATTALGSLLRQLAPQGKQENVPSTVISQCFYALAAGSAFPEALQKLVLMRMRADQATKNPWDLGQRASLLKGCLVRKRRMKGVAVTERERIDMEMNPENQSSGYLLGRLFAVLERTQLAALGEVNASIRDKYIGAAATTPARVFSTLLRGYEVHISALRKKNKGLAIKFDREMNEIVSHLSSVSPVLPKTLDADEQAEFYIAFHQELGHLWKARGVDDAADNTVSTEEE